MERQFYKLDRDLMSATSIVDNDGVEYPFTLNDKAVFIVMKSRFDFFKSLGKEHYDTIEDIGKLCGGLHRNSVSNSLKKLITCGVVNGELSRNGKGNRKWYFRYVASLSYTGGVSFAREEDKVEHADIVVDYAQAPKVQPFLPTGVVRPEMQEWLDK